MYATSSESEVLVSGKITKESEHFYSSFKRTKKKGLSNAGTKIGRRRVMACGHKGLPGRSMIVSVLYQFEREFAEEDKRLIKWSRRFPRQRNLHEI